ncbi:MAG: hypothetical protein K2X34_03140 [Hyphomonadaceae bacterium]|nr:hypothetical protein [Hyphomonadaceae bacterium]
MTTASASTQGLPGGGAVEKIGRLCPPGIGGEKAHPIQRLWREKPKLFGAFGAVCAQRKS